jgi:hypothetical protein
VIIEQSSYISRTAGTFLKTGWDVYKAANVTEDIWWILEGKDWLELWRELDDGMPQF